ncbi:MAG: hypothetical protein ACXWWC_14350 [Chitinophagaceae bacterium]
MKKLLLIIILAAFTISTATSQTVQKSVPPVKKNVIIKTVPAAPPPPPPPAAPPQPATNKSTGTANQNAPVYSLTSVRANIKTGNDNKEYPSNVRTGLSVRGSNMQHVYFLQENLKNEMRSNTNTEFGLERRGGNLKDLTLDVLQNAGCHFRITYSANFQLDAWKIEGVTVTLEFRDQNGNLHPTLGQKTINFSNANGFLNGYPGTTTMICNTDGYFNPLSAFIE